MNRVSADTSSETIRALRENGEEPIFSVDESKSLGELLAEIDWTAYQEEPEDSYLFESTNEPVFHLDAPLEEQVVVPGRKTKDEMLMMFNY